MNEIQFIEPKSDHILRITFTDGTKGVFDIKPYLVYEAFESLKSSEEFKKIHNGGYFVEWESGADLSADTLRAHLLREDEVTVIN